MTVVNYLERKEFLRSERIQFTGMGLQLPERKTFSEVGYRSWKNQGPYPKCAYLHAFIKASTKFEHVFY